MPPVLVGEPVDYESWWVQGYQSRAFVEDGDENAALAGNGPIVVPKDGSAPFQLSSALPAAVQMKRIRADRTGSGA
ncbi:YrhB domain-containing protein [Mycolicibacterium phocaicum]|uniref:YrhB domain-containing protein n=1 Tax=Mycolicibacterium phocaicum TaxID=319706 RepID=UPI001CFBE82C|nr:YrhB domain-containing protein [Mycolicibacterium phocaicum]UCZ59006.1 YrhB family protein [Mycolicibacterium phocaicum]